MHSRRETPAAFTRHAATAALRMGPVAALRLAANSEGRVHSAYERCVNLECGHGLVALLDPSQGLHPFGVRLEAQPGALRGEAFAVERGELRFARGARVRLEGCEQAELSAPRYELDPEVARRAIALAWPLLRGSGPGAVLLEQASRSTLPGVETARAFLRAFTQGDQDAATASGQLLLGLGPGLTPAFDDFLVGAAAALAFLPREKALARRGVIGELAAKAGELTTRVSREFLACAACNLFSEPVLAVLESLPNPDPEPCLGAMQALAGVGHTSGADCLAGLLAAASAFAAMPRNERN